MTNPEIRARDAWFETFFEGLMAEFWLEAVSPGQTEREADYLRAALAVRDGGRYLDIPCGAARHALVLAREGVSCLGVDRSRLLTGHANSLAAGLPLSIERTDVRAFRAEQPFDGAWCLGSSFGYMSHRENAGFLGNLARSVAPGGRIVIETGALAECVFPAYSEAERLIEAGAYELLSRHRYDPSTGYMHTRHKVNKGTDSQQAMARQAVYTLHRFLELAGTAGLRAVSLHRDFGGGDFAVGANRLVAVFENIGDRTPGTPPRIT